MSTCDVAVIGSGPYGLSLGAHLRAAGVDFRIFGEPMEFWQKHMPRGMHLKSEGFASSLYDPQGSFTIKTYCRERGIAYADTALPVPLEVFGAYGMEFQKRFVPNLEQTKVTLVERAAEGFRLTLATGERLMARRVVVAVGLTYYSWLPPELAALPEELVTHSSRYGDLDRFAGREIAVIGGGSSAVDIAALLHQAGAAVQVIARSPVIRFHDPPSQQEGFLDRVRAPHTGIGPGWKLWLCAHMPAVFRLMPEKFRIEKVKQILGPAPCWFTKEQVVGKVQFTLGVTITGAAVQDGRVRLHLTGADGAKQTVDADHVIAGTGYRADLARLTFLHPQISGGLRQVGNSPALSANFESTVPGLYFVGLSAANTFGPLVRFAFGAGFAAARLSRHLARTAFAKRGAGKLPQVAEKAVEQDMSESVAG